MKVKVKLLNPNCAITVLENGDWFDLKSAKTVKFKAPYATTLSKKNGVDIRKVIFDYQMIPLGVAMKLPSGFEAIMKGRSSLTRKFGIAMKCSGVMDNSYCGNDDEWLFYASGERDTVINEGDRICQFRIQLSQKATMWQKIKWLFSSKIKFEYVSNLESKNRSGFGSTGVK